jgi:hypothetical protein
VPVLLALVLLALLAGLLAGSVLRAVRERTLVEVDLLGAASPQTGIASAVALAKEREATVLLVRSTQPLEQLLVIGAQPAGRPEAPPVQPAEVPVVPPNLTMVVVGPNDNRNALVRLLGAARQDQRGNLAVLEVRERMFNWQLAILATMLTLVALALRTRSTWTGGGRNPVPVGPAPERPVDRGHAPGPHNPVPHPAPGAPEYPSPAPPRPPRPRERRTGTVRTPLAGGGYVEVDSVLFWTRGDPGIERQLVPGDQVQVAPDGSGGLTAWPLERAAYGQQQPHERPRQ